MTDSELLGVLQNDVLNAQTSVESILLKLRELASRVGEKQIVDFADAELRGFLSANPCLPSYRRVSCWCYADFYSIGLESENHVPMPAEVFKLHFGYDLINAQECCSSVHEIETRLHSGADPIILARFNDFSLGLSRRNGGGWYKNITLECSRAEYYRILQDIRECVAKSVEQIISNHPRLINGIVEGRSMTIQFTGNVSNSAISIAGGNNSSSNLAHGADWNDVIDALKDYKIADADMQRLKKILDGDPPKSRQDIRPRISGWVCAQMQKLPDMPIDIFTGVLMQAICSWSRIS